jgi:SAM-dependent methyltransferase
MSDRAQAPFTIVAEHYDQLMRSVPYDSWVDYVEDILERVGYRPRRVLDLACGTGAVGLRMAQRGYDVVGVDISLSMLRQVAGNAGRVGVRMPVVCQDAVRLGIKPAFDLVVCLYDSLNNILFLRDLVRAFRGVRGALKPGGLFIFDVNTIRALEKGLFTQHNLDQQTLLKYDWKSHWDPATRICRIEMWFQWLGGERPVEFREVHRQRGYSAAEMRQALSEAGLEILQVYNAYTFFRPTRWTNRAYYVVRKP